jgi:hypothetical protein
LEFKIFGSKRIGSKKTLTYEYEAKITTSFEKDSIIYSYQNIKLRTGSKFWDNPDDSNYGQSKWDLEISHKQIDNKPEIKVKNLNAKKIESRFLPRGSEKDNPLKEQIIHFMKDSLPSVRSIISALFPIADEHAFIIHADLIGGETFNVVPSKVKELEDAATPPGIKKDGSSLATTLYAMKNSKSREPTLL